MSLRIPRKRSQLPRELTQRGSDVDVLITIAGNSADKQSFGFESTAKATRRLLHQNCPNYLPSRASAHSTLCRSGEENYRPFRGSECYSCRAGQFSRSGAFVGEITAKIPQLSPEDQVFLVIFGYLPVA